ncbi:uncharacterized protein [Bemisia tabaci]|uniref:uncharacterized protein isoform X2 n=1 Tax=Bemisia tabaci TaxID=7038 RepID=UPI0008F98656|nr:PREDICTED: uncharacterized protein LOC109038121 isoform X2 [Bemisia tabaci]
MSTSKAQNKLMRALEQSLLACAKNDSSGASGATKRELAGLGHLLKKKDLKQKRPDQQLYTVLKAKKDKEESYISMPSKKSEVECTKKEVKKSKRTPVDISALPVPSYSASSYSYPARTQTKPAPAPAPPPPVNQWNVRTGADLFVNPTSRLFSSGLDFEDEMELVLAESRRIAEQEDRLRSMYYEQHLASQVLEQQPQYYEAPPKDVPFSSRNDASIFYDDSEDTNRDIYADSNNDSGDEWQPVLNKSSTKARESLKSCAKSEKKIRESSTGTKVEESKVSVSTGAVPKAKSKSKKSKKESKKEVDFATIVETKLSEPQYPPKEQRVKKSKSSQKSRNTNSAETRLHNLGIDNDFGCYETETCQMNSIECRSLLETHQEDSEFDHPVEHHEEEHYNSDDNRPSEHYFEDYEEKHYNSDDNHPSEHYVEDYEDEPYDSEAEAEISDEIEQDHEFRTSPEPTLLDNEEDCFSEIETENYDFYPETSHVPVVTRESHPELFDPDNFIDYFGSSKDDEFLPFLKNLPAPIIKPACKFYQDNPPRPKIAVSKLRDILQTVQGAESSESRRNDCVSEEQKDESSSSGNIVDNEKDLSKRPRLPGSGRLKIPSRSFKPSNNQISNAEKLQRILSGTEGDELAENAASVAPDKTDSSKFSPLLEPIYEGKGASSIESNQGLNSHHLPEQNPVQALDLPESLIKALAEEIKKLNLPDSPDLHKNIQQIVEISLKDPSSSLSKLLAAQQAAKINGELPAETGVTAELHNNPPTVNSSIHSLPSNSGSSDSLPSADQITDSRNSKHHINNSIFQKTPQLSNNSCNHPYSQMTLNGGMEMSSYEIVNNQTTASHSDQWSPQDVPTNCAVPSISKHNYFSGNSEMTSTLSEEAIVHILKQTVVSVAGDSGIVFVNSVDFTNMLPILVKTIQNQVSNCADQELFVQSFAREFIFSSGVFSRTQPPPGFNAQTMDGQTTGSLPHSNIPDHINSTMYTSTPSALGAPYVVNAGQNNMPRDYYPPGLSVPSAMYNQFYTNINT